MKASVEGFDTAVYPTFTLSLSQTATLKFEMKVGKISQSVDVLAEVPLLRSQSSR